ncbi:MAG: succinylglutamate desuccinylase/aspartoacylase family protein [Bacteriovoracaceae bacterium]|nr:succinylglutamate desuccinylase/aspartoacylase family protein [Bacteriovoracaceae bacterium]
MNKRNPFKINGQLIQAGTREIIEIHVAGLYDFTQVSIPLEVIHGKEDGPTVFISAAIHGDEINGVEIIKRMRLHKSLKNIKGTLILAPIVNVFGFNSKSRYLPDRRDLNRSFPGSEGGSLAARVANIFMKEVVKKSRYGIDLHTGAINRNNFPQLRADIKDEETKSLVMAFGAPVAVNSRLRDGSLREASRKEGVKMLLYEAGEALRFDELAIKIGVRGCMNVLEKIGVIKPRKKVIKKTGKEQKVFFVEGSHWVRAPLSGSYRSLRKLGEIIHAGEKLATISDPFGRYANDVIVKNEGLIIGMSSLPLVNQGDAMFHIAYFQDFEELSDVFDQDYDLPDEEAVKPQE